MTSNVFLDDLRRIHADAAPKIVLAEGGDPRVIKAAGFLLNERLVSEVTLLGVGEDQNTEDVFADLDDLRSHRDSGGLKVLGANQDLIALTSSLCEQRLSRKQKKFDAKALDALARQPLYQAGALLHAGRVDAAVAGAVATTAEVIRASLLTVGLREGLGTVSGGFFIDKAVSPKRQTFYFADSAVVVEPTAEQLVDIAISSCETWEETLGTPPVVAFLSFSTKGSANHHLAEKMMIACELFRKVRPRIEADGELQFDAAFDAGVGQRKAPGSSVVGRANVFIFPNLDAGNIAYKIAQRLAGCAAYGPILQGLAKPYCDLSRGASSDDIALTAYISGVRALRARLTH